MMQISQTYSPVSATISSSSITSPKGQLKLSRSVILSIAFVSILLLFSLASLSFRSHSTSTLPQRDPYLFPRSQSTIAKLPSSPPVPPSLAYLISGSRGDSARILRLLYATYHPKNHYLLHLDLTADPSEREQLAIKVRSVRVFRAAQNVNVIKKADFAYSTGSSAISAVLHGAALLMRLSNNWNWFVSLGVDDYPVVTQDDLLHMLSYLPKSLNFVKHKSYNGGRESRKLKPIIVDPGLYLSEKTGLFYASQKRDLPNSFKLFAGSSFSILSRNFIEHCIFGFNNLPRILLMYFSNTPSSLPSYFSTVLCNSRQFNRTVINNNLQYLPRDRPPTPPERDNKTLNVTQFKAMIRSGAAFATGFLPDDAAVLDKIDRKILRRKAGTFVPGGWCLGEGHGSAACSVWGSANILRPGAGAARLSRLMVRLLSNGNFLSHRCIF